MRPSFGQSAMAFRPILGTIPGSRQKSRGGKRNTIDSLFQLSHYVDRNGEDLKMLITQKCQYAMRAVLELSLRYTQKSGPTKIADIAKAQTIPSRFLEVILSQLKQGGFIGSQRGSEGGYYLLRAPEELTVGEVIRFVQGPVLPPEPKKKSASREERVFQELWRKAEDALSGVYDSVNFQSLVDRWEATQDAPVLHYSI
jgi:Rrf2 family transcriptional regulator, cysteine metabolism repressor